VVQGHHGGSEMGKIWCYDGHEIHALMSRQATFCLEHLFVIEVNPVFGQKQRTTTFAGNFGVGAKCTADHFDQSIHVGRDTVDSANKCVFSTPNHSHS